MKRLITLLLCCTITFAIGQNAEGAKPKKPKPFTPPPSPTPPPAPSVDLSRFTSAHLDQILGPLEQKVPMPRTELAQLRASFAARFSKASLAERNQFQAALAVCDAISKAMDERERAALQPTAITGWPQRAAQYKETINQLMEREKAAEASVPAPSPAGR